MKAPPYARDLVIPPNQTLRVFSGSRAWEFVRRKRAAGRLGSLVWPEGTPAFDYRWEFVHGLNVFLFLTSDIGERKVKEFALTMLRSGAEAVAVFEAGVHCGYLWDGRCSRVYAASGMQKEMQKIAALDALPEAC